MGGKIKASRATNTQKGPGKRYKRMSGDGKITLKPCGNQDPEELLYGGVAKDCVERARWRLRKKEASASRTGGNWLIKQTETTG